MTKQAMQQALEALDLAAREMRAMRAAVGAGLLTERAIGQAEAAISSLRGAMEKEEAATPQQQTQPEHKTFLDNDDLARIEERRLERIKELSQKYAEGRPAQATVLSEERYCLLCEKLGHLTTECWSTHGINDPENREIARLCRLSTNPKSEPAAASTAPAHPAISTGTPDGQPSRSRCTFRFEPRDGGRWIDDDDFGFDATLKISGDFGSDADREAYAQFLCDKLNAAQADRDARDKRDAERYRWIRDEGADGRGGIFMLCHAVTKDEYLPRVTVEVNDFDEAIDAAISAASPQQGEGA